MKAVLTRTLISIVGGALVVPFVAAAVLVGARAVAGAEGGNQFLLAVGLALVWTLFGGVKGFAQGVDDGREGHELLVAPRARGARHHAFPDTRGL